MALATTDDLEARLERDLTADESIRAGTLLDDVSGSVQIYTGQKFIRADYTMRTRIKRGEVRLPQRPVHSVTSVTDIDGNAIDHEWDGLDRVKITKRSRTAAGLLLEVVDVTYDAGPDTVPQPIVGVVSDITLRTLGLDPTEGAIKQESIDGYSYTIGSASGRGSYSLDVGEIRTLNSYRRPGRSIRMLQ